ncbi:hypothetical protein [Klebsiella pneumoniae]|uniref:hypothetical protein n=1 Tax=Klebsiella pneumoniae TaxID=573 RepID=UPI001330B76A|nr:hypothetical protein [Klebsiella pneumoniae]
MIQRFVQRLVGSLWLVCLFLVSVLAVFSALKNLLSPATHEDVIAFASLPEVNIAIIVFGIGAIIFCVRRIVKNP